MVEYDKKWPAYGLAQHKGYPTAAHMAAIAKLGPCAIHRLTFAPLKTSKWNLNTAAAAAAGAGDNNKGPAKAKRKASSSGCANVRKTTKAAKKKKKKK